MKKLIRRFLVFSIIFIGIVLLTSVSAVANVKVGEMLFEVNDKVASKYQMQMQFKEVELSGICIIKKSTDEVKGALINEFGIKAFDFIYNCKKKKLKLYNVINFLDKWYIKHTICSDLKMAFYYPKRVPRKKNVSKSEDGEIVIKNDKRGLKYLFKPL